MAADTYDDTPRPRSGVSLAKGPVALIGIASLALGVLGFIFAEPELRLRRPERHRRGHDLHRHRGQRLDLGGCSPPPACCCCSARRSTGARSRWRSSSAWRFVVGALIALSDGDDILGIVATNNWTKLIMGAARRRADRALDDAARRPPPRRRAGRDRGATASSREPADERDSTRRARARRHQRPRDDHDDPRHARGPPLDSSESIARSTSASVGCGPKPVRHHVAPASTHGAGSVPAGFVTTTS